MLCGFLSGFLFRLGSLGHGQLTLMQLGGAGQLLLELLHRFMVENIADDMAGADRGAEAAGLALRIVDNGQIALHMDGADGADLFALAAGDAAVEADLGADLRRCDGGAGDVHLVLIGNGDDQPAGAGEGGVLGPPCRDPDPRSSCVT